MSKGLGVSGRVWVAGHAREACKYLWITAVAGQVQQPFKQGSGCTAHLLHELLAVAATLAAAKWIFRSSSQCFTPVATSFLTTRACQLPCLHAPLP